MRIAWVIALTGWVDVIDTLVPVGRLGRAGLVEEGGPSVRWACGSFGLCAGSRGYRACTKPARAGTGGEFGRIGGRGSGMQRTSERLTSTGSTVTPWRFRSSTSTLGW